MLAALAFFALRSSSSKGASSSSPRVFRTDSFGSVEVDGKLPTLTFAEGQRFEKQVRQWQHFAHDASAETGVPVPWILGVIWAESEGHPNARSSAGALGLMQVLSPEARGGHSDAELVDPETNVHAGARFLARIRRPGDQLPHVASKYNAGAELDGAPHRSSSSPWGMREQRGYIDRVVAATDFEVTMMSVIEYPVSRTLGQNSPTPRPRARKSYASLLPTP